VDGSLRQCQLLRAHKALSTRVYDSENGLPNWKKANSALSKFELLQCNIKEIRDYGFNKELVPYLRHQDKQVRDKAKAIIKTLQRDEE